MSNTTQLSTRLRTWALVAGLTALTIAIGAMLGGSFLWLFVAFAVAFNVVGYFFSDRIALRVAHARRIRVADAPELHGIVEPRAACRHTHAEAVRDAGRAAERVRNRPKPKHAAVALTGGLLTTMDTRARPRPWSHTS